MIKRDDPSTLKDQIRRDIEEQHIQKKKKKLLEQIGEDGILEKQEEVYENQVEVR